MPHDDARLVTDQELKLMEQVPELWGTEIPFGSWAYVYELDRGELKTGRRKPGEPKFPDLKARITKTIRLAYYDREIKKAYWVEFPEGMTFKEHSELWAKTKLEAVSKWERRSQLRSLLVDASLESVQDTLSTLDEELKRQLATVLAGGSAKIRREKTLQRT